MLTMFLLDLYLQIEVQIFRKYTDANLAIVIVLDIVKVV